MRILAAHLKPGDRIAVRPGDLEYVEEILEVRSDAESVTIQTRPGRLVTVDAHRTVEILERRDTLLG